jgi:hypothetical protein
MVDRPSDPAILDRLRELCSALPEVSERLSHGEVAWFTGSGSRARAFATTWDHHHDDHNSVLMAAPPGVQRQLVDAGLAFRPPYYGPRGWIGFRLDDGPVDWDLIALHLADAHASVRPTPLT